ncbi:NADH-ubiquinone oxidoreductase chain N (EC [Olavius algarvensis associated proteobacterium Delta 3]|nr:NADH-ubiquinone oxidoreductase chain N (EC [Olavius algarvensis associated proteobacterium Delta 3]CAB5128908.1 NADH-ubiquinone oxidoreductase chain N (EC [Olavius algarvensis associated proteobacterium Delta 3]
MMNMTLFLPELFYLFTGGVFLVLSMVPATSSRRDFTAAMILAAMGIGVSLAGIHLRGDLFADAYRVDLFSQIFKALLAMGFFLVVCLCSDLQGIDGRKHPEFYFLLAISTLSMMMLVSSVNLVTIYVSLEVSSYSLYILVYLRKDARFGANAGIRYFVIGAVASAVMIFGMALLYGSTGNTQVIGILRTLPGLMDTPVAALGLLLTLCGFFFKLALFPFHFWAPDVYEGAANQVAAYIAAVSKVAAIAILIRMTSLTGGNSPFIVHSLAALAIISMTVGNLSAIVQKDFKRLLAFSSIAHAGYVMIGILNMDPAGYAGSIFYAAALLVMKFSCFMVVVLVATDGMNMDVAQLAGLHRRSPILALMLMMALFSLAGIPPTIGFTGKLLIFSAAMGNGYFSLVLIAMINVVISLYYYLLVLKAAYLTEPEDEQPALRITPATQLLAGVMTGIMVVGGIFPRYLIDLANQAARLLG